MGGGQSEVSTKKLGLTDISTLFHQCGIIVAENDVHNLFVSKDWSGGRFFHMDGIQETRT